MMRSVRSRLLVAVFATALGSIPAAGQGNPAKAPMKHSTPPTRVSAKTNSVLAPQIKFEKYTLPNGLDVILSEDHRLPIVAVNIWYHVGPANEVAGRTGFAHLFEHMMFEGSKHVPGNSHFRLLEGAGASLINGTTDFDRTNYFETLPSNQLALALWLESDRMGYLPDKLDQASLTNQQDVVRNERRQSVENAPYGIVEEAMFHELFPKSHPYFADVIGSHADIQAAKLADVRNFFELYYAPNNASLVIVGDFNSAQARQLVEKYFGVLKRGAPVPKITATTPPITSERRITVQDNVQLPRVYEAWITSPNLKPGDAEMDLTATILGGGRSSRLYKKLVYDKQIALDVSANQQSLRLGSVFEIQVTARPGHSAEEIEKAINEELDAFRKTGPTAAELERAQNTIETQMIRGLERMGGFGGVADRLNEYNQFEGTPDYLAKDLARYQNATMASVHQVAETELKPTSRVVVYGVPGKPDLGPDVPTPKTEQKGEGTGGEAVNADAPWRAEPPKPGPAQPLNLPTPQSFKLENGLTVLHVYRPGIPVVAADLELNSGSGANPTDMPGLASFVSNMLQQGTATRDATQIADETALLGASLNTNATRDDSSVSVSSLSKNFPAALDLLADIALHPSFPQAEIDRRRASRLASLVDEDGNAGAVVNRLMFQVLYGPKHPYGYENIGTEASLKAVTRDDMLNFWKTNYVPNNAALVVAGNISAEDLKALAQKEFGGWRSGTSGRPEIGAPDTEKTRVVIVDKAGAAQTQIRIAQIGAARSTPDYAALEVMNTELGGLFSSRINLNLREAHGYTYGAGSVFAYMRTPGPFFVAGGIRTDATGPAIEESFKELHRMMNTQMTPEELSLSIDSQSRSMPGFFETAGETAGALANLVVYDLPLDYYSQFPGRIASITTADAQAVAQKYLHPDDMIVVCVGDRATIEPQIEKLNLGKIEIRDAKGNLVQ